MDVSAEALSELKLVRSPNVNETFPRAATDARAPNVIRDASVHRARSKMPILGETPVERVDARAASSGLTNLCSSRVLPHQALASSLERKGVLATLKAQLRAHVFEAVQQRERGDDGNRDDARRKKTQTFLKSREGVLITELVSEYLECVGLPYSKRVFDAESGAERFDSRPDRYQLAREFGADASAALPVLASALKPTPAPRGRSSAKGVENSEEPPSRAEERADVVGGVDAEDSESVEIETDVEIDHSGGGGGGGGGGDGVSGTDEYSLDASNVTWSESA